MGAAARAIQRAIGAARRRKLYAVSGLSAASHYATPNGGGEAGLGTSFGLATLLRVRAFQTVEHQRIAVRGVAGGIGWHQYLLTTNQILGYFNNGAGWINSAGPVLQSSDLGKVLLLLTWLDAGGVARLALGRTEISAVGGASASYTAHSGPHAIGYSPADGTNGAQTIDILGHLSFSGAPNTAQLQAFFDAARMGADVPAIFAGATLRHRWSVREQLARTGGAVVSGQTAPAQLDDTVTGAAGDAMGRVGAPTVRVIDPAIDGRRAYGVLGLRASAHLRTAGNGGVAGTAAGLHCIWRFRYDVDTTANWAYLGGRSNGALGWQGYITPARALAFTTNNGASEVTSPTLTLAAADVGTVFTVFGVREAVMVRLYVRRNDGPVVEIGAGTSAANAYQPNPGPMYLGTRAALDLDASARISLFEFEGGDVPLTFADIQQVCADTDRLGRLAPLVGKTAHQYDLTLDVLANGGPVNSVPAQVLDRIGTDHLLRLDIEVPRVGPNGIRGVGPYSGADLWRTLPGGGIPGQLAGFYVVVDIVLSALPTAATHIVRQTSAAVNNTGWFLLASPTGTIYWGFDGIGQSNELQLTAVHVGVRLRCLMIQTGSIMRFGVNNTFVPEKPMGGYNPAPSTALNVGSNSGVQPFSSGWVECISGGHYVPSVGDVAAIFADMAQPAPLVGGAADKRWNFEQDIASAAGKVPRAAVERTVGGANDLLTRYGGGLAHAQRTERIWSYETTPILRGAHGFDSNKYYETPVGVLGDPIAGLFAAILLVVRSQSVLSAGRTLLSRRSTASSGWNIVTGTTNASISAVLSTTTSTYATPGASVLANDVGKLLLFVFQLDVPSLKLRAYAKRAEVSSGSVIAGSYVPLSVGTMQLGRRNGDVVPADTGVEVYGFTCGESLLTLSEVQALHDAVMANEDIAGVPGKSLLTVSLKQDIAANGGALPATLLDRSGNGNHFSRVGAPALASQYSRSFGW